AARPDGAGPVRAAAGAGRERAAARAHRRGPELRRQQRARRAGAVLAALPVRVRGHLGADPGGAGRRDRAREEGTVSELVRHALVLSALLFSIGALGVFLRRNLITVFMCVELMLNAVNLAFVAFSRALGALDGQVLVFF